MEACTVCVKDCGLHGQKFWYDNFICMLVGWLDSSPIGIKNNKAQSLKKTAWAGVNTDMPVQLHVRLRGPQSLAHCVYLKWFNDKYSGEKGDEEGG